MKKIIFTVLACFWTLFTYAETNILAGWDGNGAIGSGSEPTNFGWASTPTVNWDVANGAKNRYMDPGNGQYGGTAAYEYKYNDAVYNQNRILWIRFNNSETFTYDFKDLQPGKGYKFSFKYTWHNNGAAPNLTLGFYSKSDSLLIKKQSGFQANTTKRVLKDGQIEFVVPRDMQVVDYYLTIQNNANNDCMVALADLVLEETNIEIIPTTTITDKGAWCWFADPRALHYENENGTINSTYIGYIDSHGAVKATQINHINNTRSEVLIRSYFQPDDHNNPTFVVLPDERVMIFYSRHTDEKCFYYRVSQEPGDITVLGQEVRLETANGTTYPSPFILSDDPDHIYLCWRGIEWHPTIAKLPVPKKENNDVVDFVWGPYQILRSKPGVSGVRPYAKYTGNGKDKIYLTYTTTHPDNQMNNWVYFNTVDINSLELQDIKGKVLGTVETTVHQVDATDAYYNANSDAVVDKTSRRDWVWEISVDSEKKPVIAMTRIDNNKTSHDYYYAKWTGTEWKKTFLLNTRGPFHQTPETEKCYSGGLAIDYTNPNIIYCSSAIEGKHGNVFELTRFTMSDEWEVASSRQITFDSEKNNVRPYVINGAGDKAMLVWMYGDYFHWIVSERRPLGYPTGIRAGFEIPEETINLTAGLVKHEEFDNADGFTGNATVNDGILAVTTDNKANINVSASNSFTIVLSPYINHDNYYGEVVSFGNITWGVNQEDRPKPYIKIESDIYTSSNTLGNSDSWKQNEQTTDGKWLPVYKYKFFCLAITYENGVLRTYIDGLIDQYIKIDNLSLSDITIGGFKGYIDDIRVYNRVLYQDELKNISEKLSEETTGKDAILEFASVSVPSDIYTDIVVKTALSTGNIITWTSSDDNVLSSSGIVTFPTQDTDVTLTATVDIDGVEPRLFTVKVHSRNIENNKMIHYQFEEADVYTQTDVKYVRDKSGNNNDAIVYGSAQVNGRLDLSANTLESFDTNGYATAPNGLLNNLRSYTFMTKVNPVHLDKQPRAYDFGTGSINSVFARLNVFSAGIKYNNGTTVLINSSAQLQPGEEKFITVTFDAGTQTTKIYVDGEETASGTTITNEPYMVAAIGTNNLNFIGRTQWWSGSSAATNADFCGTLDDFYLFDIALTQDEIIQIINRNGVTRIKENSVQNKSLFYLLPNLVKKGEDISIASQNNSIKNCFVEILNTQGQIVHSQRVESFPAVIGKLYTPNIYLVKIVSDSQQASTLKLIVK